MLEVYGVAIQLLQPQKLEPLAIGGLLRIAHHRTWQSFQLHGGSDLRAIERHCDALCPGGPLASLPVNPKTIWSGILVTSSLLDSRTACRVPLPGIEEEPKKSLMALEASSPLMVKPVSVVGVLVLSVSVTV